MSCEHDWDYAPEGEKDEIKYCVMCLKTWHELDLGGEDCD
jgi:hypothetical protein